MIAVAALGAILGAAGGLGVAGAIIVFGRGSLCPSALVLLVVAGAGLGALVPVLGAV